MFQPENNSDWNLSFIMIIRKNKIRQLLKLRQEKIADKQKTLSLQRDRAFFRLNVKHGEHVQFARF